MQATNKKQSFLADLLASTFPNKVCYYDFGDEGKAPEPPYVAYLFDGSQNVNADDKTYYRVDNYRVELYVNRYDYESEILLELAFDEEEISYNKLDKILLDDTKLFEVIYQITL